MLTLFPNEQIHLFCVNPPGVSSCLNFRSCHFLHSSGRLSIDYMIMQRARTYYHICLGLVFISICNSFVLAFIALEEVYNSFSGLALKI